MNNWNGTGRLVKDPEIRYANGQNGQLCIAAFNLAVDRKFKKDGEQTADFVSCKAFGKTAEFIQKYFHKGMKMGVVGRIQTGSYEKDGVKHYTTDIIIEEVEFLEKKENNGQAPNNNPAPANDSFMNIPDDISSEIPFN
jgi:single-strand DNA-binding protein